MQAAQQTKDRRLARTIFHVLTRPIAWGMRALNRAIVGPGGEYRIYAGPAMACQKDLEAALPQIQAEARSMLSRLESVPRVTELLAVSDLYYAKNEWRQIMFYFLGNRIEDICGLYPETDAALRKIPGLITGSLSFLAAGQSFPAHTHYYKGYIILHLGVFVPEDGEGCEIRVGEERRAWRTGETFIIDPVCEHEGWNRTSQERVVLLAEFERPGIRKPLRVFNHLYLWAFNSSPLGKKMLENVRKRAALYKRRAEGDLKALDSADNDTASATAPVPNI